MSAQIFLFIRLGEDIDNTICILCRQTLFWRPPNTCKCWNANDLFPNQAARFLF